MRWQPLLAEIRAVKLTLARLDPRAGMPVQPPPGASLCAIEAVERRIGRPLPPSYRELLAQHDGLPGFYQGAALLGVRPLTRGTYVDVVRVSLETDLCPFGIDGKAETIFAWDLSSARADGELEVVMWMNEIGERVPSFPAFLDLVLELLKAEVAERQRPVNRGSRPRAQTPALAGFQAA
jgi:hypothetical protein